MFLRHALNTTYLPRQRFIRSVATSSELSTWITQMSSARPKQSIDLIDLERAQQLYRVLPTRTGRGEVLPEWGTPLGKGHTLVYFWPKNENEQLGQDGSSTDYNPPYPYTRRMWAGGSFHWPKPRGEIPETEGILVGSSLVEETGVAKIEEKKGMVFVHQAKEYTGADSRRQVLAKEVRIHVFRPALDAGLDGEVSPKPSKSLQPPELPYDIAFQYTPTLPLLFRFSALTFNAHRIHYDAAWARDREGHGSSPYGGPVVHGPLSALVGIEVVERWLRESSDGRGKVMTSFEYRATSPMYVDRKIEVVGKVEEDGTEVKLWVVQDGKVGMVATAVLE
ncbi:hypothetical protein NCC49_003009 [Naganishia albida]|nr:hypothetical protein NCC49_003009 [Naganishia albida]